MCYPRRAAGDGLWCSLAPDSAWVGDLRGRIVYSPWHGYLATEDPRVLLSVVGDV